MALWWDVPVLLALAFWVLRGKTWEDIAYRVGGIVACVLLAIAFEAHTTTGYVLAGIMWAGLACFSQFA